MKPLPFLAAALICLAFSTNSFAQDYVITQKKDTIFCKIKRNILSGQLNYTMSKIDIPAGIGAPDIIEYFISKDTATFILKTLPQQTQSEYIQWIEKGRINLYEQKIAGAGIGSGVGPVSLTVRATNVYLYASKGSDSLIQIQTSAIKHNNIGSHKDRIKAFTDLISDNPNLLGSFNAIIKTESYGFDIVREFIQTYNQQYLMSVNSGK